MNTSLLIESVGVSIIALGVIFLVLSILIYVIKFLVYLVPYKASDAPAKKKRGGPKPPPAKATPGGPDNVLVAVITSAIANYQGKSPDQIRITNIKSH